MTFIPTGEGWLYRAAIMDLHTRKPDAERQSEVVGWSMRDHLRAELATSALMMATQRQRPEPGLIQHSDRGIQLGFNRSSQHPCALTAAPRQTPRPAFSIRAFGAADR